MFADALALFAAVDAYEIPKPHVGIGVLLKEKLPLPFQRVAFELEAALYLLALCAGKIRVVERGVKRSVGFILVSGQSDTSFSVRP